MTHYVCEGECGGTSDKPGEVCHSERCSKKGQPFVACECDDGEHKSENYSQDTNKVEDTD